MDAVNKAILDTDILSAIMRQDLRVRQPLSEYLSVHPLLTISIITRYEILRGLQARQASSKIASFGEFCQGMEVLSLSDSIISRAAELYGNLHRSGQLIGDADILIAATCFEYGFDCVTNNMTHFQRFEGLGLRNWLT